MKQYISVENILQQACKHVGRRVKVGYVFALTI